MGITFLTTESGEFLTTESGDFIILDAEMSFPIFLALIEDSQFEIALSAIGLGLSGTGAI